MDHPSSQLVVFLSPRVNFMRADGEKAKGAPKGSALVFYQNSDRMSSFPTHAYWNWKTEQFPWWTFICGTR